MQKVTAAGLTAWYTQLRREQGYALTTIRHVHNILKPAFDDAVTWGLLVKSPVVGAKTPKDEYGLDDTEDGVKGREKAWTRSELHTFLRQARGHRLYPLFHLMAATGLRRKEVLGLKMAMLSLENATVFITSGRTTAGGQAIDTGPKSKRSKRRLPLDEDTVAVLKSWMAQRASDQLAAGPAWRDTGYVFVKPDGTPYYPDHISKLGSRFIKAAQMAPRDLPRVLYDLRHSYATLLIDAGEPVQVVSERLGHASVAFTLDHYVDVTDRQREGIVETTRKLLSAFE